MGPGPLSPGFADHTERRRDSRPRPERARLRTPNEARHAGELRPPV